MNIDQKYKCTLIEHIGLCGILVGQFKPVPITMHYDHSRLQIFQMRSDPRFCPTNILSLSHTKPSSFLSNWAFHRPTILTPVSMVSHMPSALGLFGVSTDTNLIYGPPLLYVCANTDSYWMSVAYVQPPDVTLTNWVLLMPSARLLNEGNAIWKYHMTFHSCTIAPFS